MINYKSAIRKEEVHSSLRGGKALFRTKVSKTKQNKTVLNVFISGVGPTRSEVIIEFFKLSDLVLGNEFLTVSKRKEAVRPNNYRKPFVYFYFPPILTVGDLGIACR